MSFKKNNANRFLAGLLAVLMIVSMLPISAITAFAMSEGTTYTFTVTDGTVAIENATITFVLMVLRILWSKLTLWVLQRLLLTME